MRTTYAAALIGAIALSGCSQGATEVLCEHRAHRTCDFYFDCCGAQERAGLMQERLEGYLEHFEGELTRYRCLDAVLFSCLNESFELRAAVEEGTVRIDEAALDTCDAAFEEVTESCDYAAYERLTASPIAACTEASLLAGALSDGAACFHAYECATVGAACTSEDEEGLIGVCSPPAAIGAACGGDGHAACAPGAFCADDDVCQARLQEGAACEDDASCAAGLVCEGEDEGRTCEAAHEGGEPSPYCRGA